MNAFLIVYRKIHFAANAVKLKIKFRSTFIEIGLAYMKRNTAP